MTQKRVGKSADLRSSMGKSDSKLWSWIFVLIILQTLLLGAIFLKVFNLIPSFAGRAIDDKVIAELESERGNVAVQLDDKETEPAVMAPEESTAPIRIEVLNGCGVAGIAGRTADFLIRKGYDVRDFKNAEHQKYEHTTIYVRSRNISDGEALAATIALPMEYVKMKPAPELVDIDVTLILGKDHNRYILPP